MKNITHTLKSLLSVFILFLGISTTTHAQEPLECPYFNIETSDTTGVSLALLSTNVDATISGVVASVLVEQTYYNSGDSIIDATYVFPMSNHAAIYAMEMQINDRLTIAVIKEKEEAQEIFEEASQAGNTVSLLEQNRPNVFQMSLANIESQDTVTVRMKYTELIVPKDGVYQFVFPSVVAPRYTTGGEPWVGLSENQLTALPETELNIDLKINAGMPVIAECKSHEIEFTNQINSTQTVLSGAPGPDFIVDYTLARQEIHSGLLLYEGAEENFFLSIIQPPRTEIEYESPPREYIFLMDVSGSMSGEPLDISKDLISDLLTDLNYGDKFNIIFFSGSTIALSPNSLDVTNWNIQNALDLIDQEVGGGGTNLMPALNQALNMDTDEDFSRTFIILTDGKVTVEKEAFELIRNNMDEANFFAFGIGNDVNRYIIDGIGYVGEGESFVATDFVDSEEMADAFKTYIERPALTNIECSFSGIEVYDVEPLTIPDVFAERPIIVYGKYNSPANGTMTVSGDEANGSFSETYNFQDYLEGADQNIAIQYLWARKKIKLMSDYGIADNPNDTLSIKEEITQLGLKYSLVTEYTSFVAVDSILINQEEVGDEGSTVSTEESIFEAPETTNHIQVIGQIEEDRILRFRLTDYDFLDLENLRINIYDINGHLLKIEEISFLGYDGDIIEIGLSDHAAGMYFISLANRDMIIDTKPFVITR